MESCLRRIDAANPAGPPPTIKTSNAMVSRPPSAVVESDRAMTRRVNICPNRRRDESSMMCIDIKTQGNNRVYVYSTTYMAGMDFVKAFSEKKKPDRGVTVMGVN
jgi:hypothetical protein